VTPLLLLQAAWVKCGETGVQRQELCLGVPIVGITITGEITKCHHSFGGLASASSLSGRGEVTVVPR
jgi:hypothetical protein